MWKRQRYALEYKGKRSFDDKKIARLPYQWSEPISRVAPCKIARAHVSCYCQRAETRAAESRPLSGTESAVSRPFPPVAIHYRGIMQISSNAHRACTYVSSNEHLYSCALIHAAELASRRRYKASCYGERPTCASDGRIQQELLEYRSPPCFDVRRHGVDIRGLEMKTGRKVKNK